MLTECGLSKSYISDMKNGKMPTVDKLFTIAQYLNVSLDYLMGATDDPTPPNKMLTEEQRLLAEIFKLTPEKYKEAERFVEFLKTREDFSQELSESLSTDTMKPQHE